MRHLQSTDNEQGIYGAQSDASLSESGMERAEEIAPTVAQNTYDLIIVSPLQRTRQTIEPYIKTLQNPNIIVEPLIIERGLGVFTGTRREDGLLNEHREQQGLGKVLWKPPQGESIVDVYHRAKKFIEKFRSMKVENVLVVSHQNFIRNFELILQGKDALEYYADDANLFENGEIRKYILTNN